MHADSLPAESQGLPKNTGVGNLSLLQPVLGSLQTLGKVSSPSFPFSSLSEVLYLGHQRTPFWTPGDGSKNSLHTHPSPLPHHAGIKGQRDCLWELALTAVLGKEITALVPTRSQIAPSSKRTGVMEQGGQNHLLEFPQADEVGVEAHTVLRAVARVLP